MNIEQSPIYIALPEHAKPAWLPVFLTTEGEARAPPPLDLVDLEVKGYFLIRKV